jgi:hypothetical protein
MRKWQPKAGYVLCWDGEEMKEKVVLLRELDRAIIYNE